MREPVEGSVRVPCPSCAAVLDVPSEYSLDSARCPLCHAALSAPLIPAGPTAWPSNSASAIPRPRKSGHAGTAILGVVAVVVSVILVTFVVRSANRSEGEAARASAAKEAAGRTPDPALAARWGVGDEAVLDDRGKELVYLAADGAWDDLAKASARDVTRMIARGRVVAEPNGGRVKILSVDGDRRRVEVVSGLTPGATGWILAETLRDADRPPALASRRSPGRPRPAAVPPETVRNVEDPGPTMPGQVGPGGRSIEDVTAFDARNPAIRSRRGGESFDNPSHGRISTFEDAGGRPRGGMAPRPTGPNIIDPSFGTEPSGAPASRGAPPDRASDWSGSRP